MIVIENKKNLQHLSDVAQQHSTSSFDCAQDNVIDLLKQLAELCIREKSNLPME